MKKVFSIINQDYNTDSTNGTIDNIGGAGIRYVLILVQLMALAFLADRYAVESHLGLPNLLPVTLAGFIIHSLLPLKHRLTFFLIFGVAAAFWLLSWIPALMILALIALFFGILQLPLSVKSRGGIILIAGGALAALWVLNPQIIPQAYKVVPIVGSMFMFRASIYLYEIRFEKTPAPLTQQLAYFLLFPNLILTLFPVVDYKLFRKTYYDRNPLEIYQKGVRWMIRGFFHLMLYRIVYYYIQPNVMELESLGDISFYFLTTYLLMIRLSGLFHTSAGILGLFGFNLPALFHNYYLASGFSDVWRRINTYWRDYVMKVLYYPIYFKLRKYGKQSGMVFTILIVFVLSWLLHSYQWFWLKGNFPIRSVDAVFWISWGALVAGNSIIQQRASTRKKSASAISLNKKTFIRALQVVGMFSFMAIFWTLWSSPSLADWWNLVLRAFQAPLGEWSQLLLRIGGLIIAAFLGFRIFEIPQVKAFIEPDEGKLLSVFWGGLTLALFALLTIPNVLNQFQSFTDKPVEHLYETRLNDQDDAEMIRGYYEDLLITNQLSSPLADMQNRPVEWVQFGKSELAEKLDNWLEFELRANVQTIFKDAEATTNRWGMRDQDYPKVKPANTVRIGIIGGSYSMGSGVDDDEVFEHLVENALSEEQLFEANIELLNFSVPGYQLLETTYLLQQKAMEFDLDMVIIVSHGVDFGKVGKVLLESYRDSMEINLPFVESLVSEMGLKMGQRVPKDRELYIYYGEPLVEAAYAYIADLCAENNIKTVVLHWPRTKDNLEILDISEVIEITEANNFLNIDLAQVYFGQKQEDLVLSPYDQHPNDFGHKLIADALFEEFQSNAELRDMIIQIIQNPN